MPTKDETRTPIPPSRDPTGIIVRAVVWFGILVAALALLRVLLGIVLAGSEMTL